MYLMIFYDLVEKHLLPLLHIFNGTFPIMGAVLLDTYSIYHISELNLPSIVLSLIIIVRNS